MYLFLNMHASNHYQLTPRNITNVILYRSMRDTVKYTHNNLSDDVWRVYIRSRMIILTHLHQMILRL